MGIGGAMDLIVNGVVTGVLGTVVMDSLNYIVARTRMISRIEAAMIGRMSAGWVRGRIRYANPTEMEQVPNEVVIGFVTHYAIGVVLAVPYVLGWSFFVGGCPSPVWALVYGVATTMASWFFVYPSMGLGAFGRLSPEGMKAPLSSLANHLFYGLGLALGTVIV